VSVSSRSEAVDQATTEPPPLADRSALGRRLARGEFVGAVELTPPHGWDPGELVAGAARLRDAGVHTVHIVDGPAHRSRIASIPAAIVIERELGMEAVPRYSCRDRNMLGMLSDLLGAAAAGLRNVFLITGDPPRGGPYDTGGVYDIDSIGLTNIVRQLNLGLDPGGSSIGAPTSFVKGVAVNPGAVDPEEEIRRFAWKAEAGADFAVTQPVFDPEKFLAFVREIESFGVPLVAGLWPPLSLENAEFLAHEVPGVDVPPEVLKRMARAQERGAEAAGIGCCRHDHGGVQAQGISNQSGNDGLHALAYWRDAGVDLDAAAGGYSGRGRLAGLVAAGEVGPAADADAQKPVVSSCLAVRLVHSELLVVGLLEGLIQRAEVVGFVHYQSSERLPGKVRGPQQVAAADLGRV
jgi:5,10-methylenetetrahydrofolate reductase